MKSTKILGWLVMAAALTFTGCSVNDNTVEGPMEPPQTTQTGNTIDLSKLTGDYVAQNGDVLTGTLSGFHKISIAYGATVTLSGVTIPGSTTNDGDTWWAGITCQGDATIVLAEGTENYAKGYSIYFPGIQAGPAGPTKVMNPTLTIRGTGTLTAETGMIGYDGFAAGIGGGHNQTVGNITIEGGTIIARGYKYGAGIGSGQAQAMTASCGDITITGGNIKATGGELAAGIGTGKGASCGKITIGGKARGTATGGRNSPYDIGFGLGGTCDEVNVADETISGAYPVEVTCSFIVKYYKYMPEGYMATPAYNVNASEIKVTIDDRTYTVTDTFHDGSMVTLSMKVKPGDVLTITSPNTGFDSDPYTSTSGSQQKRTFSGTLTVPAITLNPSTTNNFGTVDLVMQQ